MTDVLDFPTSPISVTRPSTPPTAPLAPPAVEAKLDEADVLYSTSVPIDRSPLERAIAVGCKLQEAQDLGGDVQKLAGERRRTGRGWFSATSARRFLRLARYATAIRAAHLTRVMDADDFAWQLEAAADRKEIESAAATKQYSEATAARYEGEIFNEMRSIPPVMQRSFLTDIIGRLSRLDRLFETSAS